jgi:hypothetical protein
MAAARLVCRAWRDCLGAQVVVATLPPELWQRAARGQLSQLRRLTAAFPLLRTLRCGYERGGPPVSGRAMRRTLGLLARSTPTVAGLRLAGMVDAASWPAIAEGLAPLAPQLAALDLRDACWPDAGSMAALAAGLTRLARLRLHSAVFSRLTPHHVQAIAGLTTLRELSLVRAGGLRGKGRCVAGAAGGRSCLRLGVRRGTGAPPAPPWPRQTPHAHLASLTAAPPASPAHCPQGFRTVEGSSAAPLQLDPLTRLSRLAALNLEYTGACRPRARALGARAGACNPALHAARVLRGSLRPHPRPARPPIRAAPIRPACARTQACWSCPVARASAAPSASPR